MMNNNNKKQVAMNRVSTQHLKRVYSNSFVVEEEKKPVLVQNESQSGTKIFRQFWVGNPCYFLLSFLID